MTNPPEDPFQNPQSGTDEPPAQGQQQPGATPPPPPPGAAPQGAPQNPPQYGQQPNPQQAYAQQPPQQPYPGQASPPPAYGAPQYGQQQPYKDPATAKNWMNITSLILSLSSLLVGITLIPGIIFGHLGRSAAKKGEANNGGLGLAGLVVGYVFLALSIIALIVFFVFIGNVIDDCSGPNPESWCESETSWTWEATA
ncbi:DUF4190 domain-containing protein [Demequina sediminicola]|uniref:DUF4190 domain-containing protein n=1 Tax=Demequina sediminicola TaxID=1095026 RepID=UPI000781B388|nr:DUF4190 domain-containing protein [Demequina sediminicola]